jgi:serine/threonine protein phosphatase PrpC
MGANESTTSSQSSHSDSEPELGLQWGVAELQGWRKTMEDAFLARGFGGQGSWANAGLFAVFDGHGGSEAAKFCAQHLPGVIMRGGYLANPRDVLRSSFEQLDRMLIKEGQKMGSGQYDHVGCTAVMSFINDRKIIVANVGDSRAVLSRNGRAVNLSQDHKPNLPKEAARIRKAGGRVTEQRFGSHIVHRVNGDLALSRSLGDLAYKKNRKFGVAEQLVSCVPDVEICRRDPGDKFMIIACDGVWDVLSSQEAVDRVRRELVSIRRGALQPGDVVEKILHECLASDPSQVVGTDNMTMILIVFDKSGSNSGANSKPASPESSAKDISPLQTRERNPPKHDGALSVLTDCCLKATGAEQPSIRRPCLLGNTKLANADHKSPPSWGLVNSTSGHPTKR